MATIDKANKTPVYRPAASLKITERASSTETTPAKPQGTSHTPTHEKISPPNGCNAPKVAAAPAMATAAGAPASTPKATSNIPKPDASPTPIAPGRESLQQPYVGGSHNKDAAKLPPGPQATTENITDRREGADGVTLKQHKRSATTAGIGAKSGDKSTSSRDNTGETGERSPIRQRTETAAAAAPASRPSNKNNNSSDSDAARNPASGTAVRQFQMTPPQLVTVGEILRRRNVSEIVQSAFDRLFWRLRSTQSDDMEASFIEQVITRADRNGDDAGMQELARDIAHEFL